MQELVATDDIYMHAILYAYDFFCNNVFYSPLSPLRWVQNSSETEKIMHYLNDQSNSPTCYISKRDIEFYHHSQLNDGWNYQKIPKTMIFSKSPRNAAVLNLQDGRNSSLGTKARCDCSWILAKGGPGSTYGKGCQAYYGQKSNNA